MLPKYYLNDYFTLIDSPILKEREFMKTDIREEKKEYIMEIDLPGLTKDEITINYENGYIMWGDCGVCNFFINKDKLKNLDFSDVLYNWDCY